MEKLIFSTADISQMLDEMMDGGARVPLYVSGTSMNPFLVDGRDIVWLRACTQADLVKGKIVLFRRTDNSIVLHRIKKILPDGKLLMNGDAQTWCETILQSQVVAVVYELERNGKKKACDTLAMRIRNSIWQLLMPFRHQIIRLWKMFRG